MLRTLCLLICIIAIGCSRESGKQGTSVAVSRFQPGQLWQYKTRSGEEASRLIIAKVESYPKIGTVVHIQIIDLAMKNPAAPSGVIKVISHPPFSEEALTKSVTDLEKAKGKPEAWEDGYNEWKSAFVEDKAGIWKITASEAITAMEKVLEKK